MFCVGSPANKRREPSDSPTENMALSAAWRRNGEADRSTDHRVEGGCGLDVVDADGDVIDVAPRARTVAVDGFEAVARGVFEKCGVVVIGVDPARACGPVIGEARVDAGLPEAIDLSQASVR